MSIDEVLFKLSATRGRIVESTGNLTPEQLRANPAPDAWSIVEVLAHLRACADMWGNAIHLIANEDEPTIRAVNPRRWIKETNYPDLTFAESFDAFTKQRADLLAVLHRLTPEEWSRTATITGAGAPLSRSILTYGRWMARHEQPHIKQIQRIATVVRSQPVGDDGSVPDSSELWNPANSPSILVR